MLSAHEDGVEGEDRHERRALRFHVVHRVVSVVVQRENPMTQVPLLSCDISSICLHLMLVVLHHQ